MNDNELGKVLELKGQKFYTTDQVKKLFEVDKNYFSKQISLGKIPRSRIGKNYLFSEDDLIAWIENNKVVAEQDSQEQTVKKKEAVKNSNSETASCVDIPMGLDREYLLKFIEANSIELINEFLTSSDDEEVLSNSDWIVDCTIEEKQREIKAYLKGIALA